MPAIKLTTFGGMVPLRDSRLLPDNMADRAENAWLYSGNVEGIRSPVSVYTCTQSNTRRVYRIPKNYPDQDHIVDSYWLEFPYQDVDVVHSVVANDQYERYYWAYGQNNGSNIAPRYNTKDRIAAGLSSYLLGIPAPTVAPTITINGNTNVSLAAIEAVDTAAFAVTATVTTSVARETPDTAAFTATTPVNNNPVIESRAYVYTWVSSMGEEGPPSPPRVATAPNGSTWVIGITPPTVDETTDRSLSAVRIYRTVTSSAGVATYFFVAELSLATTSYSDTQTDTVVSGNEQISSSTWTAPPTDLSGMQAMANGVLVGFRGNEIWFSEPYHPHAWPAMYTLVVDFRIIGVGVVGQSVIVCTESSTYACTGIDPASMTLSKISVRDTCIARGSIVPTPLGVLYATTAGLVLATPSQVVNATSKLFSKDKWLEAFKVQSLRSAMLGSAYYTFGTVSAGCFEETAFQTTAFEITDFTGSRTGGLIEFTDERTAFSALSKDVPMINLYNDPWTSEIFLLRDGQVWHLDVAGNAPREEYVWRSKIFQSPNRRNFEAMKIYYDNPEGLTDFGTVKIYADGRLVSTRAITKSGDLIRMPSGFKADYWQVEITSRVTLHNVQMATSVKELASV